MPNSASAAGLLGRALKVPAWKVTVPNRGESYGNFILFEDFCPFGSIEIEITAPSQYYNRIQHYKAEPPWIFSNTGLYNNLSLIVYQGLIHGLLWLHTTYYRPYADSVEDLTWRWWKLSREARDFYFFLASNKLSKGSFYVEAYDYREVYKGEYYALPSVIYLDKGKVYEFIIYLTVNSGKFSQLYAIDQAWMSALVSSPEYILVTLHREEIVDRGVLIYKITVKDREYYKGQSLSGENLVLVSVAIKVVNSDFSCFREHMSKLQMQGETLLKVYVGCPPGNKLAFDISYTLKYSIEKNDIYFDCLEPDIEIPCFYYEIPFYPFFLIQDMVTGQSEQFKGKYTFKVIGGGPYITENIKYFTNEEVLLYNSLNYSNKYAAIWCLSGNDPKNLLVTADGHRIFSGDTVGIQWICQKNSPCSDIPAKGLKGPEYFLVIEVSNRGIDTNTYCDYRLEFIIHLHGLPLNPYRGLLFFLATLSILWFILISFIIIRCYQSWLDKRAKISTVEPMILPARATDSKLLYIHNAHDINLRSSSSTSLNVSTTRLESSQNDQQPSRLHFSRVNVRSKY
uniref:cation channel sperm-associated auxiliary subunit gamma-like n=1 Tax=Pristiophorus japonicus TaxID=55135 RepID=UPI00398F2C7B